MSDYITHLTFPGDAERQIRDAYARERLSDIQAESNKQAIILDDIEKDVVIKIPMEVGGYSANGGRSDSTTRARCSSVHLPFTPASCTYHFPEGTKHRFLQMGCTVYQTGYNHISTSDWSTDTVDSIVWDESSSATTRTIRIVVGYEDDRVITADNLPVVTLEYKLGKKIPFAENFSYSSTLYCVYRNSSTGTLSVSPFIPVEYGKTYRASSMRVTLLLDSELNYLNCITGANIKNDTITITDPNVAYIAFAFYRDVEEYFDESSNFIGARYINATTRSLKGLKLSLLGDSISSYKDKIPAGNDAYYTGSNSGVTNYSQMWWQVLCNKTGMTPCIINAWSGSGITQLNDNDHKNKVPMSDTSRCKALHDGDNEPDVILIVGGTNDWSYANEAANVPNGWNGRTAPVRGNSFEQTYACMIRDIQEAYPNVKVYACSTLFTLRGSDNGATYVNGKGYTQSDYDAAIERVAAIMRIPYINIGTCGFNRFNYYPTYCVDSATNSTHPNAAGHKVIGQHIADILLSGAVYGSSYIGNDAEIKQIKGSYAQQIELLKAIRDVLNGGDIPAAVGLLDTYLLDKENEIQ